MWYKKKVLRVDFALAYGGGVTTKGQTRLPQRLLLPTRRKNPTTFSQAWHNDGQPGA
ncbi:hypothetical protein H6795_02815 [Candidatus Nomurabacteria bacterium]|nr:hypothetical protein [Candidatus Nomurabacteria bacterium]